MKDRLNAAAITIHAVWSVSVTTAKGGYCPERAGKGEAVVDMISFAMVSNSTPGTEWYEYKQKSVK